MADTKISALPASTTPLAGTEVLPIVQSGATVKVSVANLTAGRVISANGVAFPATASASSDPNTLDDYEEGTWTPTDASGAGLVFTGITATYTKIGRQVTVQCLLDYPANVNGAAANLGGLPFTNQANGFTTGAVQSNSAVVDLVCRSTSSSTGINIFTSAGVQPTNAQLSTNYVLFALTYFTA